MSYIAPKGMSIGHVHLKVSDLERSVAWYKDVLGLEVMQRYGDQAAFLSAGGYHHHVGLNTWESCDGTRPPRGTTGLYHAAFLYPDRASLAKAVQNAIDKGVKLHGASDHGVSQAIYFDDPDGNGIEIYRDRDPSDWPRGQNGELQITTERLDLDALLAEA